MSLRHNLAFLVTMALVASVLAAPPITPEDAVSSYIDNQTFLIGKLDVEELPLKELQQRATKVLQELVDDPTFHQGVEAGGKQVVGLRDAFLQMGGKEVYIVVSMSDVPFQPPFFVVTSSSPDKLAALKGFVGQLIGGSNPPIECREAGKDRLLVGTEQTLNRVEELDTEPRTEVAAAWKAASDAPIQLVIAPSADHHRVLQEAFPQFPRPWDKVSGQTLSEGIQWAVLSINGSPKITAELLVESKHEAAAQQMKTVMLDGLNVLANLPELKAILPNAKQLFALIQPAVNGKQLRVTLTEDTKTVEAVMKPLAASIKRARDAAKRAQSMNNLKQLALGMHIYHDKHKRFPAAASYDESGKPLLSWRVHLLPYLDQKALYDQFKLDEPWDSEHNKKLALIIPKSLLDPMANLKPGMTTYVVPVGDGTIFGGKKGLRIRDITDGTSNTLMIVCATPDQAVLWTKPEDLAVAQNDPKKGLFSEHRTSFLGAMSDGSVRAVMQDIDATILWLILGANDRQPIEWNKVK